MSAADNASSDSTGGKPRIVSVNPFRCRMWDLHNRIEQQIVENSCRAEINSFSKHGQLVAALGRPVHDDPDHDVELICGARRLFVARHLNVPLLVDVREMTDRAAVIAMDIENRQRLDFSPYERSLSFARFLRAGYFESQDDLAKALKISQSQVSRLLTLARLPSVVVGAFSNPLEIREGWGPDLAAALQDVRKRQATIARARTLASLSPKPAAVDVYQQLIAAWVPGRKVRSKAHDEVVTDLDGTPLFRIRTQDKAIAVLLPRDQMSQEKLKAVRDAVRDILLHRPVAARRLPDPASYACSVESAPRELAVAPSGFAHAGEKSIRGARKIS
jgi:ParB family transcriptional regulator, chromosome partitioning protein